MDELLPFLIVGAALVGFVLFWSGTVWLIAFLSGWHRLAGRYRTDRPPAPEAQTFRMVRGAVGMAHYDNVLRVDVQPDGLRLAVFALFRPGHPPVLIPWGEIADVERRQVLFARTFRITVGAPRVARITLPEKVVGAMREVLPTADAAT